MAETVSIEEELSRKGRGFFQVVGDSMEPLLHSHYSTVVIEKPTGRLKKTMWPCSTAQAEHSKTSPKGAMCSTGW